jgi:hypothetical protein
MPLLLAGEETGDSDLYFSPLLSPRILRIAEVNLEAVQGTDDTNRHGPPCRIFARASLRNSNEATHPKSPSLYCSQPASV